MFQIELMLVLSPTPRHGLMIGGVTHRRLKLCSVLFFESNTVYSRGRIRFT
jgi:hypothetical protein